MRLALVAVILFLSIVWFITLLGQIRASPVRLVMRGTYRGTPFLKARR